MRTNTKIKASERSTENTGATDAESGLSLSDLLQQAAIERLRASKMENTRRKFSHGEDAGRRWARYEASYLDLLHMSAINPADCWNLKDSMWMAESALEGRHDGDYMRGFLKGALEYFEEVKDML